MPFHAQCNLIHAPKIYVPKMARLNVIFLRLFSLSPYVCMLNGLVFKKKKMQFTFIPKQKI